MNQFVTTGIILARIDYGEADTLFRLFGEAREIRKGVIQAGQDTAAPNFGREARADAHEKSGAVPHGKVK